MLNENVKRIVETHIGPISRIDKIKNTKNQVYKVISNQKPFLIKFYPKDSINSITNNEITMYRWFNDAPFIKKCFVTSKDRSGTHFIVTEFLEGKTLLELVSNQKIHDTQLLYCAEQIYNYLEYCRKIKVEKFGNLNHEGIGETDSWYNFLQQYLDNSYKKVSEILNETNRSYLLNIHDFLYKFLEKHANYFQNIKSNLVPIDLNLSNFLLTSEQRFVVLDIDAFWGADFLLALGEFVGHTYGTKIYHFFMSNYSYLNDYDLRIVHFYALLSNFDILLFLAQNHKMDLKEQKPWGNQLSFFDLMESHKYFADNHIKITPGKIVEKNTFLGTDWNVKISNGNSRTVTVEETLARVEPIKHLAGITRISDITQLDSTNIFAYQSIRPDAEIDAETFTVFSGKGLTKEECKVSAIVEGIERFCAEKRNYPQDQIIATSYRELSQNRLVIHPEKFNIPERSYFSEDEVLEWVPCLNLVDGKTYYVTANTVFYPYKPNQGRMLFRYFTTGLAAGNTYMESIAHGLAEVIERDAAALNLILRNRPAVPIETINSNKVQELIQKIVENNNNKLNIIIRYISSNDIPIPVFSVLIEDLELQDPMFVSGGYGAHPNKEIALITAINEAALSRVGTISGAREDLEKFRKKKSYQSYNEYKKKYSYWFTEKPSINYQEISGYNFPTILEDISIMMDLLQKAGMEYILMCNLTNKTIDFPVVKMLVPGIERYSFQMNCVGQRARKFYKELYNKELLIPKYK